MASLVVEHGLQKGSEVVVHRLSGPSACGILVLRPGIEPVSPALDGGFFFFFFFGKKQNKTLLSHSQL